MSVFSRSLLVTLFILSTFALSARGADQIPTPAVVHPVVLSDAQDVFSLRGEWEFAQVEPWNEEALPPTPDADKIRAIQVPGCWEAQGVGEPGMSQTWDCVWDCNPRPLDHIYMGAAWYRKTIDAPESWADREIWLKVGGVRTEALFYVNGKRVGSINTWCGSYKFRVTEFVEPGKPLEIVAIVRNDTPSRKGQMCDFHKFGGFYRDVEIETTPKTWIDDAWVQGLIDDEGKTTARARFTLDSTREGNVPCAVRATIKTRDGDVLGQKIWIGKAVSERECVLDFPLENVETWIPERPTLYLAEFELFAGAGMSASQSATHGWVERFGFRRLEARGDRIYLNNNPYFMRGYGETFIYPLSLISPPDVETHKANMSVVRKCGFVLARQHTHCEIPEYFEAADESGILVQPEAPYYQEKPCEAFEFDPMRDLQELWRHYRRYTSFAVYSMGNEGRIPPPLDAELYRWVKENDPGRLVIHQDGGYCDKENSDVLTSVDGVNASMILPWERGSHDDLEQPYFAHEYMNSSVMLDPRLEPKFTGPLPPLVSIDVYENTLRSFGLTREQGDACIRAAHALQAFWNKDGLEIARNDPSCDGYSFWNFIDQMVIQNGVYTSQGCLNAFYEQKEGGCPIDEFLEFNGPTALIVDWDEPLPIFTSGYELKLKQFISHFDEKPLAPGKIVWSFRDADGKEYASGETAFDEIPAGSALDLPSIELVVPDVDKPVALTLFVEIPNTDVHNHWPFWFFPKREKPTLENVAASDALFDALAPYYDGIKRADDPDAKDALLITANDDPAFDEAKAEGRPVLALDLEPGDANIRLGWWSFGNQLGTATFDSPLFGDFPREETASLLWFAALKDGALTIEDDKLTKDWEPLVLGDGLQNYCAYLLNAKNVDAPAVRVYGLDLLQDRPETLNLLDNMIEYCRKGTTN
ncbi:MAG: hypothetical protein IK077_11340 [Thermoguttaceae bacterium]|nr:hypothetical protein [Thermoguttaceae bacterium]